MKKLITFLLCLIITLDVMDSNIFNNVIYTYIKDNVINDKYSIVFNSDTLNENKYMYKEFNINIKNTTNFYPSNKEELLNVYYTILNNGFDDFVYYCSDEYSKCLSDINDISKDSNTFTYINQLVHPYNTFRTIQSKYKSNKRVDIEIEKKYTQEDITKIEEKMNQIINELNINNYNSINDKIRVFHDYLASTNKYDKAKEINNSDYHSDTAIGTLFEGYSICSGYSDTMAIFLSKLNLENVKVITKKHVWNAVKINDTWYHIDLTWDDPIVYNGDDIISHDYFLITTDELLRKDVSEHDFDKDLYYFIK